ncbi:Aminoacyl-transfer RNA synthetases class-I [Gracilaria domingensis]|nr:Aminoacyl-transfer RNA synthetases class-I [Gracilaria domingensis]
MKGGRADAARPAQLGAQFIGRDDGRREHARRDGAFCAPADGPRAARRGAGRAAAARLPGAHSADGAGAQHARHPADGRGQDAHRRGGRARAAAAGRLSGAHRAARQAAGGRAGGAAAGVARGVAAWRPRPAGALARRCQHAHGVPLRAQGAPHAQEAPVPHAGAAAPGLRRAAARAGPHGVVYVRGQYCGRRSQTEGHLRRAAHPCHRDCHRARVAAGRTPCKLLAAVDSAPIAGSRLHSHRRAARPSPTAAPHAGHVSGSLRGRVGHRVGLHGALCCARHGARAASRRSL